jgi:hypothetical protein
MKICSQKSVQLLYVPMKASDLDNCISIKLSVWNEIMFSLFSQDWGLSGCYAPSVFDASTVLYYATNLRVSAFQKSKSKSYYDRKLVGQFVLVSGAHPPLSTLIPSNIKSEFVPHRKHPVFMTTANSLMQFSKTIYVHCENHKKYINTGQNKYFLNVVAVGIYTYHRTIKGWRLRLPKYGELKPQKKQRDRINYIGPVFTNYDALLF